MVGCLVVLLVVWWFFVGFLIDGLIDGLMDWFIDKEVSAKPEGEKRSRYNLGWSVALSSIYQESENQI